MSLQSECPLVFDKLYPGGLKDDSVWKLEKMAVLSVDGIQYIFTYHPGWRNKGKGYEEKVMRLIQDSI